MMKPHAVYLPFDPARFHDLPEVEAVGASTVPGEVCLSLTTGEDISTPPHAVTVYEGHSGQPVALKAHGEAYRLLEDLAPFFVLALNSPAHLEAVTHLCAVASRLRRASTEPEAITPALLHHLAEDARKAAHTWPKDEAPAGTL